MAISLGLRAKAMLALLSACLLVILLAWLIGQQIFNEAREYFGEAYAINFTLRKRQDILAPVIRELIFSQRLAGSVTTIEWLQDEKNPAKKSLFFREAEKYRQDFWNRAYFVVSTKNWGYYANSSQIPFDEEPRYTLNPKNASDAWFFSSLALDSDYNVNVDYNVDIENHRTLDAIRVWFNVIVRDGERKLGVIGTSIDLSHFLLNFIENDDPAITSILVDHSSGAIQAHSDKRQIAFDTITQVASEQTLAAHLRKEERETLASVMKQASDKPGEVFTLYATLDGEERLLALSCIPELKWHVVTALDLQREDLPDPIWFYTAIAALTGLMAVLAAAFGYAVNRLVLRPIDRLKQSAAVLARGDFEVSLPPPTSDELGDLSRTFGVMAMQIRRNTEELEDKVLARTQSLEVANLEMQRAHQKIKESIDYASLIQRAILPTQQLKDVLGQNHFVLWRPRDVVGGDFYIFHADEEHFLVGLFDCAGHGVPGALMTMLARATLDFVVSPEQWESPAAILGQTDSSIRNIARQGDFREGIAIDMDVGLVYVNRTWKILRFSGARINLYWSEGGEVGEIKGSHRSIGDNRQGIYTNTEIEIRRGMAYYLVTDGFLDQEGGELGYGFGNTRFIELLKKYANLPMEEQAGALNQALEEFRGKYPQQDDITVLSFRFD